MTGQLCMRYNWDQMNLCYCSAAVTFSVFVNCFVACNAVVSRGVMIGMSGESWHHKSTLSLIPSSQDWACQSSSLLLCFRLRHFLIFVFSTIFLLYLYIYLFIYFNLIFLFVIFKFINLIFKLYIFYIHVFYIFLNI